MPANDLATLEFWQKAAAWLGWALTGILSGLGVWMWNQMHGFRKELADFKDDMRDKVSVVASELQELKGTLVTREEFNNSNAAMNAVREKYHDDNTGNFRRIDARITEGNETRLKEQIAIAERLGDILAKIAELRPTRRQEGPERRHGY